MGKIYLIKDCGEINVRYKIGFTRGNPLNRLKALETGNPNRLELICVFETKFNTKLETNLHQQFRSKKIIHDASIFQDKKTKHEWFKLEQSDVDNFINICKSTEKNYDILAESNYHFRKLLNIK